MALSRMERPIQQNPRPRAQQTRFLIAIGLAGMLVYALIELAHGRHVDLRMLVSIAGLLAVCYGSVMLWGYLFSVDGGGTKWFITDDGLKWVGIFGASETIPWDSIKHMSRLEPALFIRWDRPVGNDAKTAEERLVIYPEKADAEELLLTWQKKTQRTAANSERQSQVGWTCAAMKASLRRQSEQ